MKNKDNLFIKSLNGMALGLFSSLIIGLIMKQIGSLLKINLLIQFGDIAQKLMGPAIGAGVAYSLDAPPLGILSSIITGAIGSGSIDINNIEMISIGEPIGAYVAGFFSGIISKLIKRENSLDILLIPISSILFGGLIGVFISPFISQLMLKIGQNINYITELHPIPMGVFLSVIMGMLLTLPISSAAIAISLNLSGLAAGAATIGCTCNMLGFAIGSYEDNGLGGFLAQGFGTSMLQISNIFKKPIIWLPSIITSFILGPISTFILKIESSSIGAGMGTSGLVGQLAILDTMGHDKEILIKIIILHFLLPLFISYYITNYMRKKGLIKKGDMKI